MDRIDELLDKIREDETIWYDKKKHKRNYTNRFLNNVGDIFEKYGFGTTKCYLREQIGRDENQAAGLLKIIEKFEEYPEIVNQRSIGRTIIKTLLSLNKGGRHD